jgi:hypothetical protein
MKYLLCIALASAQLCHPLNVLAIPRTDRGPLPIVVIPDDDNINQGQTVNFEVDFDKSVTTGTAVTLSSSNSNLVSVPSGQTLPANHTAIFFSTLAGASRRLGNKSTVVRITATTADGSAYCDITVN